MNSYNHPPLSSFKISSDPIVSKLSCSFYQMANFDYDQNFRDQPAFLKHLHGEEEFTSHLSIQNEVLTDIKEEISNFIYLKGPLSAELHEIEVKSGHNSIFLQKGWKDFVEKHALQSTNMLIFWYEGWSIFKVEIFNNEGLERKENRGMNEKTGEEEKSSGSELNNVPIRTKMSIHLNMFISGRRNVSDKQRESAKSRAAKFSSSKPFFAMVMKETSVYRLFYLRIPTQFARKNLPNKRSIIVLRMSGGSKKWEVNCQFSNGGVQAENQPQLQKKENQSHWRIQKGWKKFSLDNNLEDGDVCVFKMTGKKEENVKINIYMTVYVFRVIDKIAPLRKVSHLCDLEAIIRSKS
ncbi:hypothetical protein LUZ60_006582 [Juncus effusus]|nr:hypothetical protein LUZ60_006582 [Juncus effusus]